MPFPHKSIVYEQNIICSKAVICRSHGGLSASEMEGQNSSNDNNIISLQNRRDFLRKERRTRGEREARVARVRLCLRKKSRLFCRLILLVLSKSMCTSYRYILNIFLSSECHFKVKSVCEYQKNNYSSS